MRVRALFDLAIDSKLRGCDLVKIKIGALVTGPTIRTRSMVIQQKTGRPVQFEITADTRVVCSPGLSVEVAVSMTSHFQVELRWAATSALANMRGWSTNG
jgi:hypothetical protein